MKTWQGWTIGAVAALAAGAATAAEAPLKITYIDVEGGAATLYQTPQGHSLLIDAGWPAGMGGARPAPGAPPPAPTPSSAQRVVAALNKAGVTKLDYLLVSHYHVDHLGGVLELIGQFPIDTFIDHGPNREAPRAGATPAQLATSTEANYGKYAAEIEGKKHRVIKAGETLKIDDLVLTAITADRDLIAKPMPGAGGPGAECGATTSKQADGGEENARSVGLLGTWGKARVLALADLTWDVENKLVCPVNLIGKVDLMLADNHGTELSDSPNLVKSVKPTVMVFNNGPTKGADGSVLDTFAGVTGPQGMWEVHFATRSPDKNAPADQIANLADGPDQMASLQVAVDKSGAITVTNGRNGFSRTYPKAK